MNNISKEVKEQSRLTKDEWREYTKTVWSIANVADSEHPAVFPREIPKRLIKLFTFVGETVLDPFGGIGTTASVAVDLQRKAISVDQNPHYVALSVDRAHSLYSTGEESATYKCGDARNLDFIEDGSVSLVVTSPPLLGQS